MKLKAYAKINIYLKVLGKENDYHKLKMLNAKINLFDEIEINESSENELIFINSNLDPKKDNLVLKIVEYFKEHYKIKKNYKIEITKNIPVMSGLGGGSSDVAEVIKYLNTNNNLNLSIKELEKIGLLFGADIPYCLHNEPCIVEGIGEIVIPTDVIKEYKEKDIIVVNPKIELSTKDVFETFDKLEMVKSDIVLFKTNDLEEAAIKLNPEILKAKKYLIDNFNENIVMSGSGSSFIILTDKDKSNYIYNKIKKEKEWFVSINQILEV